MTEANTMQIDGGCHCGHITYRADIDPERVVICHCTDYQALSGSAYRFVAFTREDALEILTGELKIYVKVAELLFELSQDLVVAGSVTTRHVESLSSKCTFVVGCSYINIYNIVNIAHITALLSCTVFAQGSTVLNGMAPRGDCCRVR